MVAPSAVVPLLVATGAPAWLHFAVLGNGGRDSVALVRLARKRRRSAPCPGAPGDGETEDDGRAGTEPGASGNDAAVALALQRFVLMGPLESTKSRRVVGDRAH